MTAGLITLLVLFAILAASTLAVVLLIRSSPLVDEFDASPHPDPSSSVPQPQAQPSRPRRTPSRPVIFVPHTGTPDHPIVVIRSPK